MPGRRAVTEGEAGDRLRFVVATDPDRHHPDRPSWDCAGCGDAWPCGTVRAHLLHAYGPDVSGLSLAMAAHYYDAIADLTDVSPQELHLRIVGWVRRGQPIAAPRCMWVRASSPPLG
ncbi:hypothetical protein O7605_11690 [Verrucosispora sp. WMMA2121]|uniref:hypothetical protein n=1 Tax=Verrucosispora sp. WMMA2121 TaxID=3015164 RepID=UPI0022B68A4B|nr:hypothetical protein [Verrucosispora sp. WMMA2121]MCZ7420176.1 hypothetical protein [Verrucosispora sp. WMMA2121]